MAIWQSFGSQLFGDLALAWKFENCLVIWQLSGDLEIAWQLFGNLAIVWQLGNCLTIWHFLLFSDNCSATKQVNLVVDG